MKNLFIILCAICLFACGKGSSCGADPIGYYIYINKTEYRITMSAYNKGELYDVYTLNKNESDTIIVFGNFPFVLSRENTIIIDSAVVKFDNLREIIAVRKAGLWQQESTYILSLYGYDNKQELEENSGKYTMYKTFTEKDFENAGIIAKEPD